MLQYIGTTIIIDNLNLCGYIFDIPFLVVCNMYGNKQIYSNIYTFYFLFLSNTNLFIIYSLIN